MGDWWGEKASGPGVSRTPAGAGDPDRPPQASAQLWEVKVGPHSLRTLEF